MNCEKNCDLIKEKLIDYIDGNLSKKEKQDIKIHLSNCPDCKKEYNELKETILYLQENADKIKTDKDINIRPKQSKKSKKKGFKRTILIASIVTIFIAFTAFAGEIFDYISYWRESSIERTMAWDELIENGLGEKLDISVEDNGIRVTAEGVIADDLNTLVLLKVEDLKGLNRYGDSYNIENGVNIAESISVNGDIINENDFEPPLISQINLYQDEEGVNKIILVINSMDKEKGHINLKIREFMSMLNEDEELMDIYDNKNPISRVKGNWDMKIEAKKLESYSYEIDKEIILDGNKIKINNIIIAPTETSLEYEFMPYNEERDYYLSDLKFSIKYDGKIYDHTKLGFAWYTHIIGENKPNIRKLSLETLYLEKPDKIELIINEYEYYTQKEKAYYMDIDNLPQELEYEGSILTIEDIKYTDDLTEITIKEDVSEDRKYLSTNMYVESIVEIQGKNKSSHKTYSTKYVGNTLEKVKNQKISILRENAIEEERALGRDIEALDKNIKSILRPEKITIEGQEYVENPNKKIKINLKQ